MRQKRRQSDQPASRQEGVCKVCAGVCAGVDVCIMCMCVCVYQVCVCLRTHLLFGRPNVSH